MKDITLFSLWAVGTLFLLGLGFLVGYLVSRGKRPVLRDKIFYNIIFFCTLFITVFNTFFFFPYKPLAKILFPNILIESKINNMISSHFFGAITTIISFYILTCVTLYMVTQKENNQLFYEPLINSEFKKQYRKWNRYYVLLITFLIIPLSVYLKVVTNKIFGNEQIGMLLNSIISWVPLYFILFIMINQNTKLQKKLYPDLDPNEANILLSRFNAIAHNLNISISTIKIDDTPQGKQFLNCVMGNTIDADKKILGVSRRFLISFNEEEQNFIAVFSMAKFKKDASPFAMYSYFLLAILISTPILGILALFLKQIIDVPFRLIFIPLILIIAICFVFVSINDYNKRRKEFIRKTLETTKVTKEEAERILVKAFIASNIPGIEELENPKDYPELRNIIKTIDEVAINEQ